MYKDTSLFELNPKYQQLVRYANSWKLYSYINSNVDTQAIRTQYPRLINQSVYSGQKRIVIQNPADPEYVIKIATSYKGVMGNMNEIITSNYLEYLASTGAIDAEALKLFAIAQMGNDRSAYIIHQRKMMTPQEDADFAAFVQSRLNPDPNAGQTPIEFWPLYIDANPILKADLITIQNIISKFFIGSDINPYQEPLNYATTTINGQKRLVLVDLDSILPLFPSITGTYYRPKCPKCGQDLFYQPVVPSQALSSLMDPILTKGSYYFCQTEGCINNWQMQQDRAIRSETTDITIFDQYSNYIKDTIKYKQYEECNWFVPLKIPATYTEFVGLAQAEFPSVIKNDMDFQLMFDTYIFYLIADFIQSLTPSGWYQWVHELSACNYLDWEANMRSRILSVGIELYPIHKRVLSLLYLHNILLNSGDLGYIIATKDGNVLSQMITDLAPRFAELNPGPFYHQAMQKMLEDLMIIF